MGYFTQEALQANWEELQAPEHRRLAGHVILGVSIVVLSLILAGLVRFARQWRVLAGILGALVLLLLAGQIWLGILLTYDGPEGSLVGFVAAGQPAAQPASRPEPRGSAALAAPQEQAPSRSVPTAPPPDDTGPRKSPPAQEPPTMPAPPQPGQGGKTSHEEIGA